MAPVTFLPRELPYSLIPPVLLAQVNQENQWLSGLKGVLNDGAVEAAKNMTLSHMSGELGKEARRRPSVASLRLRFWTGLVANQRKFKGETLELRKPWKGPG